MDHAVAVERMITADRFVHLVLGVAQIDAVEVARDRALDHVELTGIHLLEQRRIGTVEVGVIVRPQLARYRLIVRDFHMVLPAAFIGIPSLPAYHPHRVVASPRHSTCRRHSNQGRGTNATRQEASAHHRTATTAHDAARSWSWRG